MKKLQMWYISRRKRTILQFIRRRSFVRSFNFHLPLPPRQIRILIIRCIATLAITHTEFRGHTAPLHAARITLCASCVPFCIARHSKFCPRLLPLRAPKTGAKTGGRGPP